MAKVSILQALAALKESGVTLTDEQEASLETFKTQQMRAGIETVLDRKLTVPESETKKQRTARVNEWTDRVLSLALAFSTDVQANNQNRGRGERSVRMFRVETPEGSLKIELSTDPVE